MIMNDMSARTLQMQEMKLNLGPAKGKDFSTVIGPWLVTPDELVAWRVNPPAGHTGAQYDLTMQCRVNGTLISAGRSASMDWNFAALIERWFYGPDFFHGYVIGADQIGTVVFLESTSTGT